MCSGSSALPACPGMSPAQPTPWEQGLLPPHRIRPQEPLTITAWCPQPQEPLAITVPRLCPQPRDPLSTTALSAAPSHGKPFDPVAWHPQTLRGLCRGVCQPQAATTTPVTWHSHCRVLQLPARLGAGTGCWCGHRHRFSAQTQPFSEPKRVLESSCRLALAAAHETSLTEAPQQLSLTRLPTPTQVPPSLSPCPPGSLHKTPRAKAPGKSPTRTRPPTRGPLPAPALLPVSITITPPAPGGAGTAPCQHSLASHAPARPFPKRPGFPPKHRAVASLDSTVEVLL